MKRRRALLAASMPSRNLINFEIAVDDNNNSFKIYQRPNSEYYTWNEWLDSPYNIDGYYLALFTIPEDGFIGKGITLNGRDFISILPNNVLSIMGGTATIYREKYYLTTV